MKTITIYWAGRLFNQAERIWNTMCAEKLRERGYAVILPQDDAKKFLLPSGDYNLDGLALDCMTNSIACDVGCYNLDGADVDSGTALEAGGKVATKMQNGRGLTLGIRTDFRSNSEDRKIGVNPMFRLLDDIIVYTKDDDTDALVELIDARIQVWVKQSE